MKNKTQDYYNAISKGYDELYKDEQNQKLNIISNEIKKNPKLKDFLNSSGSLLDVGCGTGISTDFFNFKRKIGIDPSNALLKIAKKKYPEIKFRKLEAESLPFKDKEFDIVISITAIQNFSDIDKGLQEIRRVGKNFILTHLKKSTKCKKTSNSINKHFKIISKIEEEKDLIFFCTLK